MGQKLHYRRIQSLFLTLTGKCDNLDPELFCACRGERSRALRNPAARLSLIGFKKKTIKVFLIGPFKFAREQSNVWRVWRVSGFFPRNVEVNKAGLFLISAIPKQHLHDF